MAVAHLILAPNFVTLKQSRESLMKVVLWSALPALEENGFSLYKIVELNYSWYVHV